MDLSLNQEASVMNSTLKMRGERLLAEIKQNCQWSVL